MIRLITGPPGAGKNTYVEKHKKDGDVVVDFDQIRQAFPHMTLEQLKGVRQIAEDAAKAHTGDAWVIRCVADPEKRTELAASLGAEEVVVLETDAETAKARVKERNRNPERNDEVFAAIDDWWSQYGVVESHLIVRPDKGHPIPTGRKNMADTENEISGTEDHSDKGFPAQTKIVDMTPEQQAAYWKFQSRKHEGNVNNLRQELEGKNKPAEKPDDKPESKPAGEALDPAEMRKQILLELKKEQAPELVRAQFTAIIGDRVTEASRDAILEDLNLMKFVKEDGSVDKDLIKARAELIAPASSNVRKARSHQGPRKTETTASVSSGKELFAEFSKKR